MKGSHIPVQYNNGSIRSTIVIQNTQDNKDCVEAAICKLLDIKKTKGCVTFGPSLNTEEALAYNLGYQDGIKSLENVVVIDAPDIKGVTTGPKKRK